VLDAERAARLAGALANPVRVRIVRALELRRVAALAGVRANVGDPVARGLLDPADLALSTAQLAALLSRNGSDPSLELVAYHLRTLRRAGVVAVVGGGWPGRRSLYGLTRDGVDAAAMLDRAKG
jgi:DNA-binding transcriptional ArsR family regulator